MLDSLTHRESPATRDQSPQPRQASRAVGVLTLLFLGIGIYCWWPHKGPTDGNYYYEYLEAVFQRGHLDFYPAVVASAHDVNSDPPPPRRMGCTFSYGPALAWTPTYLAGVLLRPLLPALWDRSADYSALECFALMGTVAAGLLCILFTYHAVRAWAGDASAFFATLMGMLGTWFLAYTFPQPGWSHTVAAFGAAALLWSVSAHLRTPSLLTGFAIASAFGFTMAARWQAAVLAPFVIVALRSGYRGRIGISTAFTGLSFAALLPQLLVWHKLYGSFLTIPQGGDYLHWTRPALASILLSPNRGLFIWTPICLLGLYGLRYWAAPPLVRASLFVSLGLNWYVSACPADWWGESMAGRRFDIMLPLLVLGLGCLHARCYQGPARQRLVAVGTLCCSITLAYLFAWSKALLPISAVWQWEAIGRAWDLIKREPMRIAFSHSPVFSGVLAVTHPASPDLVATALLSWTSLLVPILLVLMLYRMARHKPVLWQACSLASFWALVGVWGVAVWQTQ